MQSMKILEQDMVLLAQPRLIESFGRAGAQFLNQLHYWMQASDTTGVVENGMRWIYNSAKDWAKQLCLSERSIQRLVARFQKQGIIRVQKLSSNKHNRTNYYTINYKILEKLVQQSTLAVNTAENVITTQWQSASCHNDGMYRQRLPNTENKHISEKPVKQDLRHKKMRDEVNLSENNPQPQAKPAGIAKQMLIIWNQHLQTKAPATMSKDVAPLLVAAYQQKFAKNIKLWETYVLKITSSSYLMGEQFCLSIFWALKFSTIERITAGEFGVCKEPKEETGLVKTLEDIQQEIDNAPNESLQGKRIRLQILTAIGIKEYLSWFHQARFIEQASGEIQLIAPNAFVENIWKERFAWIDKAGEGSIAQTDKRSSVLSTNAKSDGIYADKN